MYLDPPIAEFVHRWWDKCRRDTNEFDQFVSGWIALLAIARATENSHSGNRDVPELDLIEGCFFSSESLVRAEMEQQRESLKRLAHRRGSDYRNPVLDETEPNRRERLKRFAMDIRNNLPFTRQHSLAMAAILYRIRNNLFHGRKLYDGTDDRELLALVNPVLRGILKRLLES